MDVLKNLVQLSKPLNVLSKELAELDWDYEGEPFIVKISHIKSVLGRFLSGEIDEKDIEDWANLLECREDIEYEQAVHTQLEEIVYTLANPALEGDITLKSCKKIYSMLVELENNE
jgi:hypothetical protein